MKVQLSFFPILLSIIPVNIIYTQTQPKTNINPSENQKSSIVIQNNPLIEIQPSDYLERHIANRKIPSLKDQVEKNLRKLGRIIRFFEKNVENSKKNYDESANLYKQGIESYYAGDVIKAFNLFLKSKKVSRELLLQYANQYRKQAIKLSSEIAYKISNLERDPLNAPYWLIHDTEHRLNVLKNKIRSADELMRFQQYSNAIDLYRNAKIIGIIALYQLEKDKTKKQQILNSYKVDLEDANYKIEQIQLESF